MQRTALFRGEDDYSFTRLQVLRSARRGDDTGSHVDDLGSHAQPAVRLAPDESLENITVRLPEEGDLGPDDKGIGAEDPAFQGAPHVDVLSHP
ncbi:MAG: hypothetical protein JNL33_11550, partial [Betaproteobacteria bacterium]|nr:hypothetical protein [Betaproteobacteria bacterium]